MAHVGGLQFVDFEDGEELVLAEVEKGVAFAAVEPLEIEDILIERDRFLDVVNLDRYVVTSVNFNASPARIAHFLNRSRTLIISALRIRISFRCTAASSSMSFSP